MKCSLCKKEAEDGKVYIKDGVLCNDCVEQALEEFYKAFVCRISRTTSGDFCLEFDDIIWLLKHSRVSIGLCGLFLSDLDRAEKAGSVKKDGQGSLDVEETEESAK